jgi:putative addiction module component (TIGR02574 family)
MSKHSTKKLIDEIELLPVEERIKVVDSVLQTLNPTDQKMEKLWIDAAEKRLKELQSGEVTGIPEEQVFEKVKERFST